MRAVHKRYLREFLPAMLAYVVLIVLSGLLLLADVGSQVRGGAVAIWVMPCLFATFGLARLLVVRRYRRHG
ncbi:MULTISPECIES: hypothetical protein [Rhodanobacter]|uniref:Uncharacterized protein n=1 Tax=Rhodanobacter denitrificans TaxID=666685 RepID=M4NI65_9GAMM|nr:MULTISPECIES: hypothetical protein [Rhodanobacter]AGG87481.1 hypothetical protein R2APBS1_0305 [Rhodanobacter denitrificans]KZC20991.1 hypothetical protein RHOFW104R3_22550 [Rhodanobacter denitrificans]UJJ51399.1 hypothetical protein LRK52_01515 [Rhodanobacter denitrificans]UJJ59818.1 hypothetical protein LRK55_06715 [Rhodanobacter denitrificans]UJM86661.1 hypothetical protein LRJ86_18090 [Rhodanobacter denitrificans]